METFPPSSTYEDASTRKEEECHLYPEKKKILLVPISLVQSIGLMGL